MKHWLYENDRLRTNLAIIIVGLVVIAFVTALIAIRIKRDFMSGTLFLTGGS